MSVYGMRHSAHLPPGFVFPKLPPPDRELTEIIPQHVILQVQEMKRPPCLPAWKVPGSGISKPTAERVRHLSAMVTRLRSEERKAFARAWLTFCLCGGEAPNAWEHGVTSSQAREIQQRFANAGAPDPRDFEGVPF